LQTYGVTGNIALTLVGSVCYLNVGNDLQFKAEQVINSDSKTNIASVAQALLDTKFSLDVHLKNEEAHSQPLLCDLYSDSTNNSFIICNRSAVGIEIHLISNFKADAKYDSEQLYRRQTKDLGPGTYGIIIHKSPRPRHKVPSESRHTGYYSKAGKARNTQYTWRDITQKSIASIRRRVKRVSKRACSTNLEG
jgi:hypothetical protein